MSFKKLELLTHWENALFSWLSIRMIFRLIHVT